MDEQNQKADESGIIADVSGVPVGTFVSSGFQMKGSSKRKVITADYNEKVVREAVLGIEKGVIKSAEVAKSEETRLVIPLPPSRTDIVRAIKSDKNIPDNLKSVPEQKNDEKNVPKTLEQLAAEELIAEMTGVKDHSPENLQSIPLSGGNTLIPGNPQNGAKAAKAAPLLAASLAPELLGLTNDDERFKADINTRPDDLNVRSDAYKSVRIEDFGAAMLRGMGWTGEPEEKKEEEKIVPRDARLGLGAMSRPPDEKKKGHKGDKHSKNDKNDKYEKNKKEWEKQAKERKKQVINENDLVMLLDVNYAGKRGSVVAVRGVPGLDRIRICLESNGKNVEIKRTDAVLLSAGDLAENPYNGVKAEIIENGPTFFGLKSKSGDDKNDKEGKNNKSNCNNGNNGNNGDDKGDRNERNERNERNDRSDKNDRSDRSEKDSDRNESRKRNIDEVDRGRGGNHGDSHREKDSESNRGRDRDRDRGRDGDRDRKEDRRYEDEKYNKRSKDDRESAHRESDHRGEKSRGGNEEKHSSNSSSSSNKNNSSNRDEKDKKSWLMTGIRVKIISEKHYKKYYKMKASIVDVPGRGIATVRLDSGAMIEDIQEKHLETVLPPVGGQCSILLGEHRGKDAILIEVKKEDEMAFIQLQEDLLGVLISMNHIACRM